MERMNEHTGLISSYQLLVTDACTNAGGKMNGLQPEQLTGAHLYLDISRSGYLFHAIGNVMVPAQKAAVSLACSFVEKLRNYVQAKGI